MIRDYGGQKEKKKKQDETNFISTQHFTKEEITSDKLAWPESDKNPKSVRCGLCFSGDDNRFYILRKIRKKNYSCHDESNRA